MKYLIQQSGDAAAKNPATELEAAVAASYDKDDDDHNNNKN